MSFVSALLILMALICVTPLRAESRSGRSVGILLEKAQAKLQSVHSLTADASSDTFERNGRGWTDRLQFPSNVALLRPFQYRIGLLHVASPPPPPSYWLQLLSNGHTQYIVEESSLGTVLHYPVGKVGHLELWTEFVAPVAGYFDQFWSPSAVFNRARKLGRLKFARVKRIARWEGRLYTVVEFQYTSDDAGLPEQNSDDASRPVMEKDYIGDDGLVHRVIRENGRAKLDVQLHHLVLNRPIPSRVFAPPAGLKLVPSLAY